jgi:hypothetical protein
MDNVPNFEGVVTQIWGSVGIAKCVQLPQHSDCLHQVLHSQYFWCLAQKKKWHDGEHEQ